MSSASNRSPRVLWAASGLFVTLTVSCVGIGFHALVGRPTNLSLTIGLSALGLALGLILGRLRVCRPLAAPALRATVVVGGLSALVLVCYVVIVVGLGRTPRGSEKGVLGLSIVAALIAVVLAEPTRNWLHHVALRWSGVRAPAATTALETFGARMTRSVPMDELLLQLAETLRATIGPEGAEIWTGVDNAFELAVAVPTQHRPGLLLDTEERDVMARARVAGNTWLSIWLPQLLVGRENSQVRVAPVAHLGEVLGLLVVTRSDEDPFTAKEDRALADLARQVGLALHNVRLDSALQESLEELQRRNAELQASRARIVAAADASRRAIERNLHDGAQQHLVALAVKVSLVQHVLPENPQAVAGLLDELRGDIHATTQELRELAHGIYPPLLRERGLPEALANAARRSVLPVSVNVDLGSRYPADVEAAAFFCCLEALQNAGKHAGATAEVTVLVSANPDGLTFSVRDTGVGFEVDTAKLGHGFTNMADRLGAIGGHLTLTSTPGEGSVVEGYIPCAAATSIPTR